MFQTLGVESLGVRNGVSTSRECCSKASPWVWSVLCPEGQSTKKFLVYSVASPLNKDGRQECKTLSLQGINVVPHLASGSSVA